MLFFKRRTIPCRVLILHNSIYIDVWSYYLPFIYSCVSFLGVLLLLRKLLYCILISYCVLTLKYLLMKMQFIKSMYVQHSRRVNIHYLLNINNLSIDSCCYFYPILLTYFTFNVASIDLTTVSIFNE
jgi:hypothetical protein